VYEEVYMRTNIVLDDGLVREAFKYSKAKTKRGLIHEALKELISSRRRLDLRDLKGKIAFQEDYDYKKLRRAG
jgi:Arc/MetJ family transcription regulator